MGAPSQGAYLLLDKDSGLTDGHSNTVGQNSLQTCPVPASFDPHHPVKLAGKKIPLHLTGEDKDLGFCAFPEVTN